MQLSNSLLMIGQFLSNNDLTIVSKSVGWEIQTKDRRGREGGTAIFSELKIADFPGLCVASVTLYQNHSTLVSNILRL